LITGSAIEIAGYVGMFLFLTALQTAGLIFALINTGGLRNPPG
jgi:hypothetical protein